MQMRVACQWTRPILHFTFEASPGPAAVWVSLVSRDIDLCRAVEDRAVGPILVKQVFMPVRDVVTDFIIYIYTCYVHQVHTLVT